MKYFLILFLIITSVLVIPITALADSGDIEVTVEIWGDNPDAWIDIYGDNANVFVNGVPLGTYISSGVSSGIASSVPNGQYSGGSSPGWQGYFGITNNDAVVVIEHKNPGKIVYSVYKGAGCGGAWGVSDGYPDFWSRRQLLGLLPILAIYKDDINSLALRINTLEAVEPVDLTGINKYVGNLRVDMDNQHTTLKAEMDYQANTIKEENSRRLLIGGGIAGFIILVLLIWISLLTRRVSSYLKGMGV